VQAPQLFASVLSLMHVPFAPKTVPVHRLGKELGQAGAHALDAHDVAPFTGAPQTWSHAPQLLLSFVRSSHDVGAPTGQPLYPDAALHAHPQALPLHVAVEFAGPEAHAWPHALQFCGSSVVLTHVLVLVQYVGVEPEQPLTHAVPLHTGVPPEHVTPQAPQLGDVVVLVSQPSSGLLVQWA